MTTILKDIVRKSPVGPWLVRRHRLRYVQKHIAFYRSFIGPNDVVFDVGANVGWRTLAFWRLGRRVVAVEPQPSCADALARLFSGDRRVIVCPCALGAASGEAELHLCDESVLASLSSEHIRTVSESGRFAGKEWKRSIRVPVRTLDELIEGYGEPAFIKIDVEGFESEVIQGLSRPIAALSIEYTPEEHHRAVECLSLLDDLGI